MREPGGRFAARAIPPPHDWGGFSRKLMSQLVKQPFEKQARLEELQIRQRELDNLLDLTKGENTAVEESEEKEVELA